MYIKFIFITKRLKVIIRFLLVVLIQYFDFSVKMFESLLDRAENSSI